MSSKTPDNFSMFVPSEAEPERSLPATLEVVDYGPTPPKKAMKAGAYDPYERLGASGDTARIRKPRVDLRQLSEWIKTTQRVEALREDALQDDGKAHKR